MEVEISSLSKNYGKIQALKNVSLLIEGNGLVTFLGANGAGKTTLFKILTSIVRPSSGSINVNGVNVDSNPRKVLSNIGSLVEEPEFYPYLTGRELLEFTAKIRGESSRDLKEEVERVSRLTDISGYLERKSGEYSRGMKQRLGVAVALVGNPELLVLDEPTFGMDPKGMLEMRKVLRDMKKDKDRLIIMSTHLLEEARALSDRTIILKKGEIKYDSQGTDRKSLVRVTGTIDPSHDFKYGRIIEIGEGYYIFDVFDRNKIPEFNRELLSSGSSIMYISSADELEKEFTKD
ncbi:MAG: ABC transporter ATP-binding protein [Thermoplasmatales archaeon]|nr:ABC transporter ATP-binding protein [Candidatus Thermoplasmatota archaeon]MCL6002031.1 ABC transporter ATP-binding protein [Candidatus Thermoplasmatota archaeon]MDA8054603.1 ABC transporter ATP-binding protein [Thermoplasmatales archaeon]